MAKMFSEPATFENRKEKSQVCKEVCMGWGQRAGGTQTFYFQTANHVMQRI